MLDCYSLENEHNKRRMKAKMSLFVFLLEMILL